MTKPLILLTNDDGLDSPGLAAAAAAVASLGDLLIVAPRWQQTGMGRSRTQRYGLDGCITAQKVCHNGEVWDGYAVNATPANCVLYGARELATRPVDLVISGINYGENVGNSVTMSGTVGAAIEAAYLDIPALAVSLEIDAGGGYYEHVDGTDFGAAAVFTRLFAERLLAHTLPADVDLLKIEVPAAATASTAWAMTRQDRLNYYDAFPAARSDYASDPGVFDYTVAKGRYSAPGTDAHALAQGLVAVTPLSVDLTSRIGLDELSDLLRNKQPEERPSTPLQAQENKIL
jgi:5'-nucleotidase